MATPVDTTINSRANRANLDENYKNGNSPYSSINEAKNKIFGDNSIEEKHTGLTVLVKESGWTEAKEYWVQPLYTTPVTYGFVPKQAAEQVQADWNVSDSGSPAFIKNKPTIPSVPVISTDIASDAASDAKTASPKAVKNYVDSNKPSIQDSEQGSTAVTLDGAIHVSAVDAEPNENAGVEITPHTGGGVEMKFILPKGADGQNGITPSIDSTTKQWMIGTTPTGVLAEGHNPNRGTYNLSEITNAPTGIDGDYIVVVDASGQTPTAEIYKWDSTLNSNAGGWDATGITPNDAQFDGGQLVINTKIDNTQLANPASNALAKAVDVKGKTDRLEAQVGHGTSSAVYEDVVLGSWTDGKTVWANSGQPGNVEGKSVAGYITPVALDESYKGKVLRYTRPAVAASTDSGLAFYETTYLSSFISGEKWLVDADAAGTLVETDIEIPQNANYVKFTCPTELKEQFFAKVKVSELFNYTDGLGKQVAENTQAIEDLQNAEGSVSMEDTDFLVNVKSVNLFNGEYEVGSYRVGGKSSVSGYNCTMPMWLESGKTYKWKKVTALGANSKYVGVYGSGEEPVYTGVRAGVDNSDGFIRFTPNADGWYAVNIGGSVSSFMVCVESEYPDTYVPYEDKWTFPELTVLPQNVADLLRGLTANPLYGKKVVFDGDSICAASRDTAAEKGWAGRIGAGNNMAWANKAVSGGTITSGVYMYAKWVNGSDAVYTQNKHITAGETYCYTNSDRTQGAVLIDSYDTAADAITAGGVVYTYSDSGSSKRHWVSSYIDTIISQYETLDYLIFEGGTNDADLLSDELIGSERNATWRRNYAGPFDDNTFVGALDSLFKKAITAYPNAVIGFIVAQKMGKPSTSNYVRRKQFFDIAMEVCEKWGVRYIDLWDECPMNPGLVVYWDGTSQSSTTTAYADGQHPTTIGYDIIVPIIERWMRGL